MKSLHSRVDVPGRVVEPGLWKTFRTQQSQVVPNPAQIDQNVLSPDTGGPLHTGPPVHSRSVGSSPSAFGAAVRLPARSRLARN